MFGAHPSIAGGIHNALIEAEKLGLETVQVFTKNLTQWGAQAPGGLHGYGLEGALTRPVDAAALRATIRRVAGGETNR